MNDTFTLSFLYDSCDISKIIMALFVISNIICLFYSKTLILKHSWLLNVALLFAVFVITTFFLNKYVATVTWVAFRHYLGFIPVIYVSCTSFILVLRAKYFNK